MINEIKQTSDEKVLHILDTVSLENIKQPVPLNKIFTFDLARGKDVKVKVKNNCYTLESDIKDMSQYIAQTKFDGIRYAMVFETNTIRIVSRTKSKLTGDYINKVKSLPHLTSNYKELPNFLTIIDGEMIGPKSVTKSSDLCSILGSLSQKAIKLQEQYGKVKYKVFDCLFYNGQDLRNEPLHKRQYYADKVVDTLQNQYIDKVISNYPTTLGELEILFNSVLYNGGEGLMLKHKNSLYGKKQWIKVKRVSTYDLIISGYLKTSSKRYSDKGWIRSIQIGVLNKKTGKPIIVGAVSGMTEAVRDMISKNKDKYLGAIAEISAQQFWKKSFQNPQFIRLRPDKDIKDCTTLEDIGLTEQEALLNTSKLHSNKSLKKERNKDNTQNNEGTALTRKLRKLGMGI